MALIRKKGSKSGINLRLSDGISVPVWTVWRNRLRLRTPWAPAASAEGASVTEGPRDAITCDILHTGYDVPLVTDIGIEYWVFIEKHKLQGGSVAEWLACWTQAQKGPGSNRSRDAVGNSLRQAVHTHRASVHQAAKLAAALIRVAWVTAGLAESNGSLSPGLWLTSPAGWLQRIGISSGTLRSVIEYGLPFYK